MGWTLSPPRTAVSVWLTLPTPAPISQIYLEDTRSVAALQVRPLSGTTGGGSVLPCRREIEANLAGDPSRRSPPQPSAAGHGCTAQRSCRRRVRDPSEVLARSSSPLSACGPPCVRWGRYELADAVRDA